MAWIIGWDLILEYAVSNMAVAVGFSAYIDSLLSGLGLKLPDSIANPVFNDSLQRTGSYFNVPGFVIVMLLTVILVRGIRESETRMLALGYNVWRYKLVAFVFAAVFAGLAGSLYAYYNRFVSPDYLQVARSAEVLLMVILGGAGTLIGPAVGAVLIVLLENVVSAYTERWLLLLGIIYVVVSLFAPNGLIGLLRDFRPWRATP